MEELLNTLDLGIVVPGTADAMAKGCTCPHTLQIASWPRALLISGGHGFDVQCPIHRRAVLAEVQRMFGRPQ